MIKQIAKIALIPICISGTVFAKEPLQTNPQTRPEVFAIIDVNVVPMDREGILEHRTVIVRGDRISGIGPAKTIEVPAEAKRLDGRGKYLMPGLADMHAHVHNEDHMVLFLANGVTTVRNMFGNSVHLAWREQIEAGELFGPTIYTAGPIIDGDPPVWSGPGRIAISSPEQAAKVVEEQVAAGYDFLKVYTKLSKEAYDVIMAKAKEHGIPVAGHIPGPIALEHALASGQVTNEHLTVYNRALQAEDSPYRNGRKFKSSLDFYRSWKYVDLNKLPDVVEKTKQAAMWNCPTLVTQKKYFGDVGPEMRFVSPTVRARWEREKGRRRQLTPEAWHELREAVRTRMQVVKALHDTGCSLLLGTDTPIPFA